MISVTFKITLNKEGLKLETKGDSKKASEIEKGLAGGAAMAVKHYLNGFIESAKADAEQRRIAGDILASGKNGSDSAAGEGEPASNLIQLPGNDTSPAG